MRASFYKHPAQNGAVLVLGASNIAAIDVMDVITKIFNEGNACLLKMNPVNARRDVNGAESFVMNSHFTAVRAGGAEGNLFIRDR